MKKFGILFLVLIFSANSIIVPAWGASCPHKMTSVVETHANDMPCHEEENEQAPTKNHCDRLCLCSHVTAAPSTILGDHNVIGSFATLYTAEYVTQNIFLSFIHTPQGPPPKLFA